LTPPCTRTYRGPSTAVLGIAPNLA
jgi:hypothetical protein